MSNAEKLLDVIQREQAAATRLAQVQDWKNTAQKRCHEAQQELNAIQVERWNLLTEFGGYEATGASTLLSELIHKMTEPRKDAI